MKVIKWSDAIQMGELLLKNRIVMPALTRERCTEDGIPTDLVAQYYGQRCGAGLIFTESVAWCQRGRSSTGAGNLFTEAQAAGWKKVTDTVHSKGSKIMVQLSHAGRATNFLKTGGLQTWAPSAIPCRQKIRYLGCQQPPTPKEMTLEDIEQTKRQFRNSISLAKMAGFDGIQLQIAHGYLFDQFLRSCTNSRTDHYGGSISNRVRFSLEMFDIARQFYQPWALGVRISPASRSKDMFDANPVETYGYLLTELSKKGAGFAQIRESTQPYNQVNHYGISSKEQIDNVCQTFRPFFKGVIIGNDSFDEVTGLEKIRRGDCDMISFGQYYVCNPDLAERIINGCQINTKPDKSTFYGNHGSKGFTDYPPYSK